MYTFSEWTQEGDFYTAYILDVKTKKVVDTVYQNVKTKAVHTHKRKKLSDYNLSI